MGLPELPLVTVIIPTFNRREIVKEAVKSVLDQDYPKIEVIVVDDGSIDGTGEELKEAFGPKIKYIYQNHGGASRARNKGVIEAKGDLVCFLDSDDLMTPNSVSSRVRCFLEDERCEVAYGIGVKERRYRGKERLLLKKTFPSGYILKEYVRDPFITNNDYMISKSNMLAYGMYKEDLTNLEDFEFFVRLSHKLFFKYCGTITSLLRDKGQRARHNFENIIAQGTKAIDHIFADHELSLVLKEEKNRLYGESFLRVAKANLKLRRPREFRRYFKMAREIYPSAKWNLKFWRRWLLSLFLSFKIKQ
ncbi:MAG TPA: glycosyltransferase family 2 protein [Deltaproteobacteria bacterium]|nr:glycosyltransferase family 2 protein [Deltaproteobacteria bacterium]